METATFKLKPVDGMTGKAGHGITRWAKLPFGGYAPADFVEARVAELKAQVA